METDFLPFQGRSGRQSPRDFPKALDVYVEGTLQISVDLQATCLACKFLGTAECVMQLATSRARFACILLGAHIDFGIPSGSYIR